ncbi:MAG: beta-ketoacyl synthase N-terminal-like domain-containing protein, partial [bacterium]
MARRVVVTGMGVISPCGLDEPAFWNQLVTGCGGVRRIQAFDPAEFKSQNGAEVDSVALAAAIAARGWKAQESCVDMALLASAQALEQAGLYAVIKTGGKQYKVAAGE